MVKTQIGECDVPDCHRPKFCKGLCGKHDTDVRKYGAPQPDKFVRITGATEVERFWFRIDADGDCWLWTGAVSSTGYGQFRTTGSRKTTAAHRYAWELLVAPIPPDMTVDHLCRVRTCVNPDHIEIVTRAINTMRNQSPSQRQYRAATGTAQYTPGVAV